MIFYLLKNILLYDLIVLSCIYQSSHRHVGREDLRHLNFCWGGVFRTIVACLSQLDIQNVYSV